jgi:4-hydroxy-tetrahydrodipicolinate synthase
MDGETLPAGAYPAMATPMRPGGAVAYDDACRLLARFEAAGCSGVVLAGTNGEGPSLAAVEKRDLLRAVVPAAGALRVVLCVATPSLEEACWSAESAAKAGAHAVLAMPPAYFREAEGIMPWFFALADRSPLPVLVYNFPKRTGLTTSADDLGRLLAHPNIVGAKDSSSDQANLAAWRAAAPGDARLFVGDETLLLPALEAGWEGTISGAANLLAPWIARVVRLWHDGDRAGAATAFGAVAPAVAHIRAAAQPAANKAAMAALGWIGSGAVRLPLTEHGDEGLMEELGRLGTVPGPG